MRMSLDEGVVDGIDVAVNHGCCLQSLDDTDLGLQTSLPSSD